jgi:hypothetical protein
MACVLRDNSLIRRYKAGMRRNKISFLVLFFFLCSSALLAWQDDATLFMRNPLERFGTSVGTVLFPNGRSEVRLGRYIEGDQNHSWRGGVEGDVTLLSFGPRFLWHWALNMETLADDRNDINFRLVQVYYQSLTSLSWHVGPGVWSFSFSHRCSHGADNSVVGRILIRSGLKNSYEMPFSYKQLHFLLRGDLDVYLVGQNSDLDNQSRGQAQVAFMMMWPIKHEWWMLLASSFGEELQALGTTNAFFITAPASNFHLRPMGGLRIGMRIDKERVKNDYSLSFSHIPDTGFGKHAQSHNGLSFDINFYW